MALPRGRGPGVRSADLPRIAQTSLRDVPGPIELIHTNRRPPSGVIVYTDVLAAGETQLVDALMNATGLTIGAVEAVDRAHRGIRGLRQLRETLALVDGGAESPYESLTRLLLVRNGFPPVETQIAVCEEDGWAFARIDMGWPEYLVGVDFEGAHHWSDPKQRSWDITRLAKLTKVGWIDERLTSGILHNDPQSFLDRVGAALISRGCPKTW